MEKRKKKTEILSLFSISLNQPPQRSGQEPAWQIIFKAHRRPGLGVCFTAASSSKEHHLRAILFLGAVRAGPWLAVSLPAAAKGS